MKYQSKTLKDKQLAIVAKELKSIERQAGIITPEEVVDRARKETSPLHGFFTWDDSVAAESYRRWQARELIAKVFVKVSADDENPVLRAFVNVTVGDEDDAARGYISIETAKKHVPLRDQVLQYAQDQLIAWDKKFGAMKQFMEIHKTIKKLQSSNQLTRQQE